MIETLIRRSLQQRVMVLLVALGLLTWGSWQALNTPVDVFPDLTAPQVIVVADARFLISERVVLVDDG